MENRFRERCYRCFRPTSLCFCESIPRIKNRTAILILQHVGERFHPFNTARIVQNALDRCQVVVDHNRRLAQYRLPILANAGLLYPRPDAPSLTEVPVNERPKQLVIVDGTWHQARTIVRDVPQLSELPCYRLAPSTPGRYRIRREPNAQSLSTVEATVGALQSLEPDTVGLDQLLAAFNQMVEKQLEYFGSQRSPRQRTPPSRPHNVPGALLWNPQDLVVAYGEATPGQSGKRTAKPMPVNWVAQRLGSAQRFSCRLLQKKLLSTAELAHMRLSAADFDAAVSGHEFRNRWSRFVRPNDVLVVYHPRTYQLLRNIEAVRPRCLALKSIFGQLRPGFHSLEELVADTGIVLPISSCGDRANCRLEMAVALVEHLREERYKGC